MYFNTSFFLLVFFIAAATLVSGLQNDYESDSDFEVYDSDLEYVENEDTQEESHHENVVIDPHKFRFMTVNQLHAVPDEVFEEFTEAQAREVVCSHSLQNVRNDRDLFSLNEDFSGTYSNCSGFKDRMQLLNPQVQSFIKEKCADFYRFSNLREKYNELFNEILTDSGFLKKHGDDATKTNQAYFIEVTENIAIPFIQEFLRMEISGDEHNLIIIEMWQTLVIWRRKLARQCGDIEFVWNCRFFSFGHIMLKEPIYNIPIWQKFLEEKYGKPDNMIKSFDSGFGVMCHDSKFEGHHEPMESIERFLSLIEMFKSAASAKDKSSKYRKALEFYYRFNGLIVLGRGQATLSGWLLLALLRSIGKTFDLYVKVDAPKSIYYTEKMQLNLYSLSAETLEEFHKYIGKYKLVYDRNE